MPGRDAGHGAENDSAVTAAPGPRKPTPWVGTWANGRDSPWANANNFEVAYTPTNSSWLQRIEAQLTALRHFALDGTGHPSHKEQASMIRRYIVWRNNHAYDERPRRIVGQPTAQTPA